MTQTPQAIAQPSTRATSIGIQRFSSSGTMTRIVAIKIQTSALRMTNRQVDRSGIKCRLLIADNPYNRRVQPLASLEALADPIYEAFYGLKEQPFAISTDPKFLFMSASHERAFEELVSGLRRHEGILLLTGETGTGKTTICRKVLGSLGDRTFSALILNPYMSGAEMLRAILRDFGFVSRDDLRRGALAQADVPQLLDALEGFLASIHSLDSHAVVVIDEAQSLPAEVLDQIRLLTAYERDGRRLIQVVLVGQPPLIET